LSEPRNQFAGTLLLLGTVAAVISAVLSFQHLRSYPCTTMELVGWTGKLPTGGPQVVAAHVRPGSPGDYAGIKVGRPAGQDWSFPIHKGLDVPEGALAASAAGQTRYTLRRNNRISERQCFYPGGTPGLGVYYQFAVGFAYLAIGMFVYYRRTSAAKSLHFFASMFRFVPCFELPLFG
jgi:two-component system NtrC family sensor kinase